jgi:hypothetical protein
MPIDFCVRQTIMRPMKSILLAGVVMALSVGFAVVRAQQGVANAEPGWEAMLKADFPGEKIDPPGSGRTAQRIQQLPPAERNRIAVAAARELSLTTNGQTITAETVDVLPFRPAKTDTPAESTLRELYSRDFSATQLLRDMENLRLITDPRVIKPLIDMLDMPGTKTSIPLEACQVLCQVTRREYDNLDRPFRSERREEFVQWWKDWWAKNHDRHPVYDDELQKRVVARVAAIRNQIFLEVHGYHDWQGGFPEVNVSHRPSSDDIAVAHIDSSVMSGVFNPTQKGRMYLRIAAHFQTPRFNLYPSTTPSRDPESTGEWEPMISTNKIKIEQIYREEIPGTDIAIKVTAASQDGGFAKAARECMLKPPESMQAEIAQLTEKLKTGDDFEWTAFSLLCVGEYAPVIACLSSTQTNIENGAVIALAGGLHPNEETSLKPAIPPLIHLLQTAQPWTRYLAAWCLGHLHQEAETTIPALIAACDDTNEQTAAEALQAMGDFIEMDLNKLAMDWGEPGLKEKVAPWQQVALATAERKLSDTRASVTAEAARTIGRLGLLPDKSLVPTIVDQLSKLLSNTNEDVRDSAAWSLGNQGSAASAALPELLKLANGTNASSRIQARAAVNHIDPEAARKAGW